MERYPEQYQPRSGPLRPVIPEVVHKFLDCGNLERGFARVRCDECSHEYLLAFSCKSRWFCPPCHQKKVQTTAAFILDQVVAPVPHRHYVLAIPSYYSNKMRGVRHRVLPPELVPHKPGISPPPPAKLPSKKWRDLILRVWHTDPLLCPVCQSPMRVIAVIDDPGVVQKILRHLGAWHDPPADPFQNPPLTFILHPSSFILSLRPLPDYDNVLTD